MESCCDCEVVLVNEADSVGASDTEGDDECVAVTSSDSDSDAVGVSVKFI